MSIPDLAIHSKRVLIHGELKDATLYIHEGKIIDIVDGKGDVKSAKVFEEAKDSVVMPGLIDCHVHINEPGRTEWEGFETATSAAAAGGITTLVDMPLNSTPVTTSVKNLNEKLEAAKGKLFVDCGFYGGIVSGDTSELEPLINAGVLGFKAFLTHSGIDDFPNASVKDLEKAAPILKKHNVPLLAHAELDSKHKGQKAFEEDSYSYKAFLNSRPRSWEDEAIKALITLCEKTGVHVHIVHLSSSDSLPQIRAARSKGIPLTVETCPHYLFFDAESIPDGDTRFKCTPPIREKENNALLWAALKDKTLDFIVTDHSPAPPDIKELESGNLRDAWGGISSLQFSLAIVWTLALRDKTDVAEISRLMSTNVADFLGLKNKGRLEIGADADIVIWSPEKKLKVSRSNIRFRHPITPYEGQMLSGLVEQTFVRGIKVYDKGSLVSSPTGNVILRKP
ncbi:MAG: allantoinase AllB [Bacteroidia bacterium]